MNIEYSYKVLSRVNHLFSSPQPTARPEPPKKERKPDTSLFPSISQYSDADAHAMFAESNLRPITRWQDPESLYSLWLLERPAFAFPRLIHPSVPADAMQDFMESVSVSPVSSISELSRGRSSPGFDEDESSSDIVSTTSAGCPIGPFSTPSLAEYRELWKLWDEITLGMIAPGMLHEKPIHLRHICLFYLGHIPA